MCGIAGIISPHANFVQHRLLKQMADVLQHRGPQGEAFWMNEQQTVGFAHRRLCILDLTENAAQPLSYLHYKIIFNGEIYNHIELKQELKKHGYIFSTQTDTEVIPAAYDYWGKDCLQHFDGMFAFALWDDKEQNLFIARDRFGEKPLYYHADYAECGKFRQFLFASEMKALFAAGVAKNRNGTMLLNYLTLGYVQNPQKKTETFYTGILSLPPGNYLMVQPAAGKVQMHKWYQPALTNINIIETDAIEKFSDLFFTSVQRRLRSDVPVGTSLSGGLDSSSILAGIKQVKQKGSINPQWKNIAFTASFPGFDKDETEYSKQVAEHFAIQQHFVAPQTDDWINNWQQLMYHQEEPLQSSSVLTQFLVYRLAKQNSITVLLDGQGADEILGGYKKYVHWYLQQMLRNNASVYKREKKLLQQHDFLEQWNWKNYAAAYFPEKASEKLRKLSIKQQNTNDIHPGFLQNYQNKDTLHKPVVRQLEDILYYNTFQFGLEELLRYADRNSMAHSREIRLPFLNNQLVEFVFSLPSHFKIKDGFTKWILRKSMDTFLPNNITWQAGKTGFEPPQKSWMQNKEVQSMMNESKKKLVNANVLSSRVLKVAIQPKAAHDAGNKDWRYLCAAALV